MVLSRLAAEGWVVGYGSNGGAGVPAVPYFNREYVDFRDAPQLALTLPGGSFHERFVRGFQTDNSRRRIQGGIVPRYYSGAGFRGVNRHCYSAGWHR